MHVYRIDPLTDVRWTAFVNRHPRASIFHSRGWLEALHRTYGYEPVVYTTSAPRAELTNGIPFCRIRTWLTGRRLVSLPFSDHCEMLAVDGEELESLLSSAEQDAEREGWQYVEIRPESSQLPTRTSFHGSAIFSLHVLELRRELGKLFASFHKDCVQRKIRRAEREGLVCEEGREESLLAKFYSLLLSTRRRQGLPPQPRQWFRNLLACLGDNAQIRVASKNGQAVAAILTLTHKQTLVYKYGCSERRFNRLGGTQLLFWRAIQQAAENHFTQFDLGRTDPGNSGLNAFKERWGAVCSQVTYYRSSLHPAQTAVRVWDKHFARHFFSRVPDPVLAAAGRLLYRHIG